MESTKKNPAKLMLATLLILLLTAPLASTAFAQTGDREDQTPPEDAATTDGDSMLYASEEDENPMLIQPNDEAQDKAANDSSTSGAEDPNAENDQSLIAPLSAPDNTATIIGAGVLIAALAIVVTVAVVLQRRKRQ